MTLKRNAIVVGSSVLTAALVATVASCGGGSDSPPVTKASIDLAGVTKALGEVGAVTPMCSSGSAALKSIKKDASGLPASLLAKAMAVRKSGVTGTRPVEKLLSPTPPGDSLGDCGGRATYPSYSHANGVTTATLSLENFCVYDYNTGLNQVLNGSISIVDNGTPSANGPITQNLQASSSAGITVELREPGTGGALLASEKFIFNNFVYTPGVPGVVPGDPTASNPDRYAIGEVKMVTAANVTYRQTDYLLTYYYNTSGGEVMSVSGRGYRSNGDYYDVTTDVPLVFDSVGNVVSGQLTMSGASGTKAVARLVPGPVPLVDLSVNGALVPSLPACP
jgi:hypothetical protein